MPQALGASVHCAVSNEKGQLFYAAIQASPYFGCHWCYFFDEPFSEEVLAREEQTPNGSAPPITPHRSTLTKTINLETQETRVSTLHTVDAQYQHRLKHHNQPTHQSNIKNHRKSNFPNGFPTFPPQTPEFKSPALSTQYCHMHNLIKNFTTTPRLWPWNPKNRNPRWIPE